MSDLCASFNYTGEIGTHRAMPDVKGLLYILLRLSEAKLVFISGLACEYGSVSLSVVEGIGPGTARRIVADRRPCTLWDLYDAVLSSKRECTAETCSPFLENYVSSDMMQTACQSFVNMVQMLYL